MIRELAKKPARTRHVVALYRPVGSAIPPIDVRAELYAAGWGAKIIGVHTTVAGEELIRTYWCA